LVILSQQLFLVLSAWNIIPCGKTEKTSCLTAL